MSQELGITARKDKNTDEWYTQAVTKTGLADYGPVKGTMIVKPYGMKIWENIKSKYQDMIEDEVENAYFPLFIPQRLLDKEEEVVDGFGAEVAYVEDGKQKDIDEKVALRPTSESIITEFFSEEIRSHRQLPYRINQWANVVRWEVSDTNPFLRTREFLWQEGHTVHENSEKADKEAKKRLDQYSRLVEEELAIPTLKGYKPKHDKFPGADHTYTVETLMPDGKSVQSATSHNLGEHFSKAFDITFEDTESKQKTPSTTSWGLSTRVIGALILAHGDDKGLRLPPKIAPIQTVIVPIKAEDENKVTETVNAVSQKLEQSGISAKIDDREHRTPGYKFNEWEMKGVPLRIEIGPEEAKTGKLTVYRRDKDSKTEIETSSTSDRIQELLDNVQNSLYSERDAYLQENIREAQSKSEILQTIGSSRGYVRAQWCGNQECEQEIKSKVSAEIVILPEREGSKPESKRNEQENNAECAICGETSVTKAYFAKNY